VTKLHEGGGSPVLRKVVTFLQQMTRCS